MPKVKVAVPHNQDPQEMVAKAKPMIEKTVRDFEGRDMDITWGDTSATFRFKSMAFTIAGSVDVTPAEIVVEVDLPFAALMFKDRVEKAIRKNLTRSIEGNTDQGSEGATGESSE